MSVEAKEHLNRVLPISKFDFGKSFSAGFDLWKQGFWAFFGFGILYMTMTGVVGTIPYVGTVITNLILAPILTGGAYLYCRNLRRDGMAQFESFFTLFSSPTNLILAYFIYALVAILFCLPFFFSVGVEGYSIWGTAQMMNYFEFFDYRKLFLLLPIFFGVILFSYVVHFVVFYKLSAVDAVTYSVKFCSRHYFIILLFFIAVYFVAMLGVVGLFFGIFFTFNIIYPMSFESFRLLTDLNDFESRDERQVVIDHLID